MEGNSYLYFSHLLSGTADDTGEFKASDFISVEIQSATGIYLRFKAAEKYNTKAAFMTLTLPTLAAGSGTSKFREACQVISGLLNSSNNMTAVADVVGDEFIAPFTSVTVNDVA
jgi:hypothetical protein